MKTIFAFATTLCLFALASASAQVPLYWDPGQTTGASLGGTGNWDTNAADANTANWFNGSADVVWTNSPSNDAYFEGTAGTVTVVNGEEIYADDLYFTNVTGQYLLTTNTGAEVLNVANTIDNGGSQATIAVPLANSSTLNINGSGTLSLTADNLTNLTGSVLVNAGTLSAGNNWALGNNSVTVANGAALEFNSTNQLNIDNDDYNLNIYLTGSGIANGGALVLSNVTVFYGNEIYLDGNTVFNVGDGVDAFVYEGEAALTASGNYNLTLIGTGGNFQVMDGGLNLGTGSLILTNGASYYDHAGSSVPLEFNHTYVGEGSLFFVQGANGTGTDPATLMTTNITLDGGTFSVYGSWNQYANSGVTVTTNGATIEDTDASGTVETASIYDTSNAPVTFDSSGGTIEITAAGSSCILNLGMAPFIMNGGNIKLQSTVAPVYSNLVENACTFTFNYDLTSGQVGELGTLPSTFCPSNIWLNGGQFHVGHSTTIQTPRGIYVTPAGVVMNEVTSGGTPIFGSTISGPGTVTFTSGNPVLATNNSYGNTVISSSTILKVGNNGAYGTLGTGNTSDGGSLYFNRTGSYIYGGIISGSGTVSNIASGVITLTGNNSYSGATTINAGAMLFNGDNTGAGAMAVNSGAALGGSGTISGPVTVASGGALDLGLSTLTINNNLSLAGNVGVQVNSSASPSSGEAVVSGTLTGPSTLSISVTNVGPALTAGETFTVFNKALSGTTTINVTGGGTGVTWSANPSAGTITVLTGSTASKPVINKVQYSGGNFIFSGTNGVSGTNFIVLTSTNLLLPTSQWTPISTNPFLSNGGFSFTNAVVPSTPAYFYLLQIQ